MSHAETVVDSPVYFVIVPTVMSCSEHDHTFGQESQSLRIVCDMRRPPGEKIYSTKDNKVLSHQVRFS